MHGSNIPAARTALAGARHSPEIFSGGKLHRLVLQGGFIVGMTLNSATLTAQPGDDRLIIPVGQQGEARPWVQLPLLGQQMRRVEAHFGKPDSAHPAVGEPPVTRWDYPGFSVYFEHGTVIHSVRHHQPTE